MKKFKKIVALAALLVPLGWAQGVAALHPLVSEKGPQVVLEPALVGKWSCNVEIMSDGKDGYIVKTGDEEDGTLRLMRFHGMLLGDWVIGGKTGLRVHVFLRIEITDDQLRARMLGSDWMVDQIKAYGFPRYEVVDSPDRIHRRAAPGSDFLLLRRTRGERRDHAGA